MPADRVIPALAAEYYHTVDHRTREALRPIMEVIERAAPGVSRLARTEGGAGFAIHLAERPFPASDETALRQAVTTALATEWGRGSPAGGVVPAASAPAAPGLLRRLVRAVRRLFSASA